MQKINGSPFNLRLADNETIKVEIINRMGLGPNANYAFNGADPVLPVETPYTRLLHSTGPNADPDPSFLSVRVTYAGGSGGRFTSRVTGDHGGDTSLFDCQQGGGQAEQQLDYKISFS